MTCSKIESRNITAESHSSGWTFMVGGRWHVGVDVGDLVLGVSDVGDAFVRGGEDDHDESVIFSYHGG